MGKANSIQTSYNTSRMGTYPNFIDKNDQLTIWRLFTNYIICGERLYRRSYDGIHLLCVTTKEAQ